MDSLRLYSGIIEMCVLHHPQNTQPEKKIQKKKKFKYTLLAVGFSMRKYDSVDRFSYRPPHVQNS